MGLGAEPPVGSRDRAPGGGQAVKPLLKQKSFRLFSYKKGPKVKYLNERKPLFLVMGVRPVHPCLDPPVLLTKNYNNACKFVIVQNCRDFMLLNMSVTVTVTQ